MKVLKFGGTSVGTPASMRNLKGILEGLEKPAVVVVSALGGLTDQLIATAKKAAAGEEGVKEAVDGFRRRHHEMIEEMVLSHRKEEVHAQVGALLDELEKTYGGVSLLKSLSDETLALVVSFGERMSSIIVANLLEELTHKDSLEFIKTEKWFGRNIADSSLTESLIRQHFSDLDGICVCGGFISRDRDTGEITNLGRGGSDYTAALIAATLDAGSLEIWTDVDGFMTADPRIIPQARVLDHMSFVESMELCNYGAKVIYPPTIYPVFHKNIPIRILNTFHPQAAGTLIDDVHPAQGQQSLKGVSALKNVAQIYMSGPMAMNVAEMSSRSFNALAKKGINVYTVSPGEESAPFSFAVSGSDAKVALQCVTTEFTPELSRKSLEEIRMAEGLTIVALVGEGMSSQPGLMARLVNGLRRDGISVLGGSDPSSDTTLCVTVPGEDTDKALRNIHSSFLELAPNYC